MMIRPVEKSPIFIHLEPKKNGMWEEGIWGSRQYLMFICIAQSKLTLHAIVISMPYAYCRTMWWILNFIKINWVLFYWKCAWLALTNIIIHAPTNSQHDKRNPRRKRFESQFICFCKWCKLVNEFLNVNIENG